MKTAAVIFPFDLFGSAGTGAGAELIGDELREVLADNRREKVPTRARSYTRHIQLQEFTFETQEAYRTWRPDGRQAAREAFERGDFLVWISGNHLGALPVYDELVSTTDDSLIVQFDAHLDIHHFADCTPELSHGNFLLHCDGKLPPLINFGHRELLLTADYVGRYYQQTFSSAELAIDDSPARAALAKAAANARRVIVDIDCDVLDPAFFPAVSRQVPFGLDPRQLLHFLGLIEPAKLAGVMISEFDPSRDRDDRSLATLIWLIEYLLLSKYE
jgi:arginase family enzyme